MDRLACVELAEFPLQLLLRREPTWAEHPVAVVAEDRPQAFLLWVNEEARGRGVLPGLRYAQGLALASDLRAGPVSRGEILAEQGELTRLFQRFTPEVEPSSEEPGTFWLGCAGLHRLFPSLRAWAEAIAHELAQRALVSSVVVGFSRFGPYALARADRGTRVLASPEEERELVLQVPLVALGLDPALRDSLHRLGLRRLGELLALPANGLLERFGPLAYRLHRLAGSDPLWMPLQSAPQVSPPSESLLLDDAESDLGRLLFLIKPKLGQLLRQLARQHQALTALELSLKLEKRGASEEHGTPQRHVVQKERLRPAAPTLDPRQLLELLRLRLSSISLESGVIGLELRAEAVPAAEEQLQLFARKPRRDLDAANRALARLRAELGETAVVHAALQDRHLPEARFSWEPLARLATSHPRGDGTRARRLIRRIHGQKERLGRQWRLGEGPIGEGLLDLGGPYLLSGGWWGREVTRVYHFAESPSGELLWIYYDPQHKRWLVQGSVE